MGLNRKASDVFRHGVLRRMVGLAAPSMAMVATKERRTSHLGRMTATSLTFVVLSTVKDWLGKRE
jgi:hypothetical protein